MAGGPHNLSNETARRALEELLIAEAHRALAAHGVRSCGVETTYDPQLGYYAMSIEVMTLPLWRRLFWSNRRFKRTFWEVHERGPASDHLVALHVWLAP